MLATVTLQLFMAEVSSITSATVGLPDADLATVQVKTTTTTHDSNKHSKNIATSR